MRSVLAPLLAAVLTTGCVYSANDRAYDGNEPDGIGGDITLYWTINGGSCPAEVEWVRIRIEGPWGIEPFQNGLDTFACWRGEGGIRIFNFAPSSYTYTLEALDRQQHVLYRGTGSVRVNGNVERRVDLKPVTGNLVMYWAFGAEKKACAAAGISGTQGVTKMRIRLNDAPAIETSCELSGTPGISIDLEPGSYWVLIEGIIEATDGASTQQQVWYRYRSAAPVQIAAGQLVEIPDVQLEPVAAGVTFKPVIKDQNGNVLTCEQAGVKKLAVVLYDWQTPAVQTPEYVGDCATMLADGIHWSYLQADEATDTVAGRRYGTWLVRMDGWDPALDFPDGTHDYLFQSVDRYSAFKVMAGLADQSFTVTLSPR